MEPKDQRAELEQRERRQRALSDLARQSAAAGPAPLPDSAAPALKARRPRRARAARSHPPAHHWRALAGVALALVILAGGGAAYYLLGRRAGSPSSPALAPIPALLSLNILSAKAGCPSAMAWSPDGLQLAVLALSAPTCAPQNSTVVLLYDARRGKLVRTIYPDELLGRLLAANTNPAFDVRWSPNGRNLLMPFFASGGGPGAAPSDGLLVVPARGGRAYALETPSLPPSVTGQAVFAFSSDRLTETARNKLPVALSYRWTPDGDLAVEKPLPPADAPNPYDASPTPGASGSVFSVWQSGMLEPLQPMDASGGPEPGLAPVSVLYESAPTLWSPDGHYFATLSLGAILPGATSAGLRRTDPLQCRPWTGRACSASAVLPYPDPAMRLLATRLRTGVKAHPNSNDPSQAFLEFPEVPFAWNPAGQMLAAILPGDGFGQPAVRVTLLSATSGAVVGTLSARAPVTNASGETAGVPPIKWSPSGQQLALMDYGSSLVTIWGAGSLPR